MIANRNQDGEVAKSGTGLNGYAGGEGERDREDVTRYFVAGFGLDTRAL